MSALVEKKTGLDGRRTLIQGGLVAWCKDGSIFAQDIAGRLVSTHSKSKRRARGGRCSLIPEERNLVPPVSYNFVRPESA